MRDDHKNIVVQKTFRFSLGIILFCEILRTDKKFELASQLFKSGTSIGANTKEAQNAESNADFIQKFKVAAKEADETLYWLQLCKESDVIPSPKEELFEDLDGIIKIISKIISSAKNR